ncbi:hypothetical protein SK128_011553 [Halocaridina rubra]|uniref:VWFC domain-containing protein n=1 Tax=Halocaridina rubra TaxID=373956 RepID=A0AAN8XAD3_HALRR
MKTFFLALTILCAITAAQEKSANDANGGHSLIKRCVSDEAGECCKYPGLSRQFQECCMKYGCCPVCKPCTDDNGEVRMNLLGWYDANDACIFYRCIDAVISQTEVTCPEPQCPNPVQDPGECCPSCPNSLKPERH